MKAREASGVLFMGRKGRVLRGRGVYRILIVEYDAHIMGRIVWSLGYALAKVASRSGHGVQGPPSPGKVAIEGTTTPIGRIFHDIKRTPSTVTANP